ncbi:MAG: hypothetical protein AABX70_01830 [Nanoarchaeota archaeon]
MKRGKQPKQHRKGWMALAGLLSLVAAGYGGYQATVHHYLTQWQERQQSQKLLLAEDIHRDYRHVSKEASKWEVVKYVRRLNKVEATFDSSLEEITRLLEKEHTVLEKLTGEEREKHGYIVRSKEGLKLQLEHNIAEDIEQYFTEALNGDFRNKEKIVDFVEKYPGLFGSEGTDPKKIIPFSLDILQTYASVQGQQRQSITITNGESLQTMSIVELEKIHNLCQEAVQEFARQMRYMTIRESDVGKDTHLESLLPPNVIARFHTHPKNDPNYPPSTPDQANTYTRGPSIVVSQTNGTLHRYILSRGKKDELPAEAISNP